MSNTHQIQIKQGTSRQTSALLDQHNNETQSNKYKKESAMTTQVTRNPAIPARFRPLIDEEDTPWVADEVKTEYLEAEATIIPSLGLEVRYNIQLDILEADIREIRGVVGELLSWLLIQESHLPGAEVNR